MTCRRAGAAPDRQFRRAVRPPNNLNTMYYVVVNRIRISSLGALRYVIVVCYFFKLLWDVTMRRDAAARDWRGSGAGHAARETMLRYSLCPSRYQCIIRVEIYGRCGSVIVYRCVIQARVRRTGTDRHLPAGSSERRLAMNPDIGSR